jgi:murein DD-endopeptidase MepM/ murein hydrolase activator NlpD
MDIILVSTRLAQSRTIRVTGTQIAMVVVMLFGLSLMVSGWVYSVMHRMSATPVENAAAASGEPLPPAANPAYVAANLNALAVRLGEMQAQLLRLDSFGARLAKLVGVKPEEFKFDEKPGRGGPVIEPASRDLSMDELGREIGALARSIEERSDMFGTLDSLLRDERLKQKVLPTQAPVTVGYHSSDYGMRRDPFTGRKAFHSGIDFVAPYGTPFTAAAAGVIVSAERHPEYGNMIEIDHGNGLHSRYGHASKLLVKVGDVVLKGQEIGLIGNTGRSTGTHLHFEVRKGDVFLDPKTFLDLDA